MRLIQHKKEAWWFYRFLSLVYDRINPLFWTEPMREQALELARLDNPALRTVDVGAGTGFTTEGIVARILAEHVVMVDQSPHQLARSERKPSLGACRRVIGDAEALPFADESFDRYVSAGSIEYWPDPARAVREAARVLRPGGIAVIVGPVPPRDRVAGWLARAWMLFPREDEYRAWFTEAGFTDVAVRPVAPGWSRDASGYGLAIAGVRPDHPLPAAPASATEQLDAPMGPVRRLQFAARFVAGTLAGLAFVPIAAALAWKRRA